MKGKTNVFSGNSIDGEYLNISVSTTNTNQELINGATIKILYDGEEIAVRWYGDDITVIIPSGVTYTISPMHVENHHTPADIQYTAIKGNSRTVNITYVAFEYSTIRMNQNISDPDTMISGDINSGHFKMILDGTHRYLAKQTSEDKCHIIQLDDANSHYYHNGDSVTWVAGMDVVIRIPSFSYLCEEVESDIYEIKVHYGEDELGGNWIYYDGNNCLIDVFSSTICVNSSYKSIPRSLPYGVGIQSNMGTVGYYARYIFNSAKSFISQRSNWNIMPIDIYNILIMLYYARYGTTKNKFTDLSSTDLDGHYMYNYKSINTGMSDIEGSYSTYTNNVFLGLDSFCNRRSFINAQFDSTRTLIGTMHDGTTRVMNYSMPYRTGIDAKYISKCFIGPYMDWLPKEHNATSNTTSFCSNNNLDSNYNDSGNVLINYFREAQGLLAINSYSGTYDSETYKCLIRKVFHGDITEYSSVSLFENKTDIYA